ncbi:hypothetical protein EES39_22710 [Streptomyces sp. ADI92-24]|nr:MULTISPECIES: hypothetical protein [unclassified Streptomyces]ROQ76718.1 hypothetical protein EDD95_3187 [Streptomyces sp. CEV 2-1]RPK41168.1 hypothetical protein EES39_22710 [Streptomyces sp. ADI92-24]
MSGTLLPLALIVLTALALAGLALVLLARPWLSHGEVAAEPQSGDNRG